MALAMQLWASTEVYAVTREAVFASLSWRDSYPAAFVLATIKATKFAMDDPVTKTPDALPG